MWKIRLYWFPNDAYPADGDCKGETDAREYAAKRSGEVQGRCDVLQNGKVVGSYVGGKLV